MDIINPYWIMRIGHAMFCYNKSRRSCESVGHCEERSDEAFCCPARAGLFRSARNDGNRHRFLSKRSDIRPRPRGTMSTLAEQNTRSGCVDTTGLLYFSALLYLLYPRTRYMVDSIRS